MNGWFVVIFIVIAVLVVGGWYYFRHLGEVHGISTRQALRKYWRRDLDLGPITMSRMNLVYQWLIRRTGKRGPAGDVMPVSEVIVEMPDEDYVFMRQYGIDAFAQQLREYRHRYALKHGWYRPGDDPAPVRIERNTSLMRLRPKARYQTAHDGKTRVITAGAVRTRRVDTEDLKGAGAATEVFEETAAGLAHLRLGDEEWALRPSLSPYRFGRAGDNDIHVGHEEVSSYHATLTYSGEGWFLDPLKTTNRTKVNGRAIDGATELGSGDAITVATFGPMVFEWDQPRSGA